ncbi:MAG: hypothetical protein AAB446_00215 [Patescibacteria group bacterium]
MPPEINTNPQPVPESKPPVIPQTTLPTKNLFKKPVFLLSVILIILIAVGFVGLLKYKPSESKKEFDSKNLFVRQAENGKVIEAVPLGLIVDEEALILASSERASSHSSYQTFVTSYKTKLSQKDLESKYQDFIKKNNFKVINVATSTKSSFSISAISEESSESFFVNLTRLDDQQNSIVMIIFNKKK